MLTLAVIFFVYGDVMNDRFFSIFENLNTTLLTCSQIETQYFLLEIFEPCVWK